jgi:GTP-binding protein Era
MKEKKKDLVYVRAVIFVERDSQKAILIGKKGGMLKKIGASARVEAEKMLDKRVYLDLWVKVYKNWRKDERALKMLGYI